MCGSHIQSNFLLLPSSVVMVTICTEHSRSRNMEATFKGNPITGAFEVDIGTICTNHTRSKNKKTTFK